MRKFKELNLKDLLNKEKNIKHIILKDKYELKNIELQNNSTLKLTQQKLIAITSTLKVLINILTITNGKIISSAKKA